MRFEVVKYESKKYDFSQIKPDQLNPPKERLAQNNPQEALKFVLVKVFDEVELHEEYHLHLSKTFTAAEGRKWLVEAFQRRFTQLNDKLFLGTR